MRSCSYPVRHPVRVYAAWALVGSSAHGAVSLRQSEFRINDKIEAIEVIRAFAAV